MRVLTIDLDYISTNYAKLVDNHFYNDFADKRWGEFYNNTYFKEEHFTVNIDNWMFVLDVFTKALVECTDVAFGYEHDSILHDLQHVDEEISIVNIDQHHDICYLNEQYKEVVEYDIVSQADWVLWLIKHKKVSDYVWINNKNSTPLDSSVVELDWNYQATTKENLEISDYKFDYIFVCGSPQYLAPHHWYHFDIMKMIYENITGNTPEIHKDKFGYDLSKHYKYKGRSL